MAFRRRSKTPHLSHRRAARVEHDHPVRLRAVKARLHRAGYLDESPQGRLFMKGLTVRETCMLSLTFDHRVVDGAPAAQLLDGFVRRLADDHLLLGLA